MNFIDFFKKFIYKNIYIYNLVIYFFKYIYPYYNQNANRDNIILLFNYYLWFNLKFYIIYIDVLIHFTN